MPAVYKYVGSDGEFMAFWRESATEVALFSNITGDYAKTTITVGATASNEDDDVELMCSAVDAHTWSDFLAKGHIKKTDCVRSTVGLGVYFPRIWRGSYKHVLNYNPIKPHEYGRRFHESEVAVTSLFGKLFEIFKFVEPRASNYDAFGHRIRELLILTCTEIEASFRAILRENSTEYESRDKFSTIDFVKLSTPLRLKEWKLYSRYLPDSGDLTPFLSWDDASPTQSIHWYDAYNAVKHDREKNFERATLGNLISAMAALHIVTASQWGPDYYGMFNDDKCPFYIDEIPNFVEEIYVPDASGDLSSKVRYFDRSWTG